MPDPAQQLSAVREMLSLFRVERYTYLAVNVIALLMLFASAVVLLLKPSENGMSLYAVVTALFGSSGLITYSIGRLLHMWDQAFALLQQQYTKPEG
ncbi:hypothetical protein FHS83_001136 [Rhizomicrobium palustre]|uniref:Uncharacterized protein n=1 Tax=Rhizomicrobium palustre TaxID=189966 RepID=A0A846MW87_9PROT|nr:hypothetical protein [Rhizomicrobium palustre]NIK87818.1 hypothetical protein [Rhizomicrobium palustre]